MSANTRQLLAFISFSAVWSLLGTVALGLRIHPLAVFAAWIVGFVWSIGYIVAGPHDADLLLKRWLQLMATAIIFGAVISAIFS